MKFRETIYPYNFDFENETLLQHWHITRFLNELQSSELFTLDFKEGQLFLQFGGVFQGLGFKRYHFERKNAELAQRTLRELSRGLIRFKKTNVSNKKIGINFYVETLKNEDRNSEVVDVITKLTGLIGSLKTSGVNFLEDIGHKRLFNNCYVSPLLLSYWIERWDRFNGSTLDEGFWSSVTYDGSVRSLEAKLIDIRDYWTRNSSLIGLKIYFPQKRYVLIQDVTETTEQRLPFTNYVIQYFPQNDLSSIQDLQHYVDGRHLSLIHIIPHFLIYHVHNFNTSEDLTHYLEWSIYRAQKELPIYTSSVTYNSGLRFTRGCVISFNATEYQKFLNYVLWNTAHFFLPQTSNDYLQWKSILIHMFNRFSTLHPDADYSLDGLYPAPKIQREYIRMRLSSLPTPNDRAERLSQILYNYLNITYDAELPQPKIKKLGRTEMTEQRMLPTTFSELPAENEFNPTILPTMQFVEGRIQHDNFKNQRVSLHRNLLGAILVPIYTPTKPKIKVKDILKQIADIRSTEYIRTLAKKLTPINLEQAFSFISDILLEDNEVTVSFWFALLLHYTSGNAMIENVSSDNDEDPSTYGLECTLKRTALQQGAISINSSTPKLISVFDSIFHYWSAINNARVTTRLSLLKSMLRNVIILGAVGGGDPIGDILQRYFHSSVFQVGAFGAGKVIRAEAAHFEYAVSYTAIISDIDMGSVETKEDLDTFLSSILISYMRNIEPSIGVFKINYATTLMMQHILEYLQREFPYFYDYTIMFITPQFGKIGNYEKYLVFIRHDNRAHERSYLTFEATETTLINDVNRLSNVEYQCRDADDFTHLVRSDFPRMYFFVTSRTSDIREILTVLSHRSDRIVTSKSFGSDSVSYYATATPSRIRLCLRISTLLQLTNQLSERFDVQHLSNSGYIFEREERILSLGNYYRELSRVQILTDDQGMKVLESLSEFTSTENQFHYIGIGDERGRNILCVPPSSPYTIYDKKNYPQLAVFNITCVDQYFPFNDEARIDQLIKTEFDRHDRKLKMFFMFMIFNNALKRELILERIRVMAQMLHRNRAYIDCIYFNTYLKFFGLPNVGNIVVNQPYTIYNDITISASQHENQVIVSGTFSKNYELVELLEYHEIQKIADDAEVRLVNLPVHLNHINFTLWNLGLSPSSFDMNGITIASEFIPVLKFE